MLYDAFIVQKKNIKKSQIQQKQLVTGFKTFIRRKELCDPDVWCSYREAWW